MTNSDLESRTVGSSAEPRYSTDEPHPESEIVERRALTEREDGTVHESLPGHPIPGGATNALPIIELTRDEHQPIDAVAEYNAPSEREDGTNSG